MHFHNRSQSSRLPRAVVWTLVAATAGCTTLNSRPKSPRAEVRSLSPTTKESSRPIEVDVLENQVMRFADTYVATMSQAVDDFIALPSISPIARTTAVRWKLSQATVAYVNATGPNPVLNVLDMVVFATASRLVMENELDRVLGQDAVPLLETHRRLEASAWAAVSRVLKPELREDLKAKIEKWHADNPNQRYVAATRLQELAAALGAQRQTMTGGANNVFRMLYLDPLAGLDPTAAAIQETRRLAERAMYYTQRMPSLLNWQVQLLTHELSGQPETRQLLADVERISRSVESFGKVADQLPQLLNDQREAAIRQLFDELADQEKKFRELAAEMRQTLQAGTEAATAVNASVESLDAFVRSVKPPAITNAGATAGSVARRPFDVTEYTEAAAEFGATAQQINTLVATLNETTPQLERLVERTGAQSRELVNYAFYRALWLLTLAVVGTILIIVVHRRLASRDFKRPTSSSQPGRHLL